MYYDGPVYGLWNDRGFHDPAGHEFPMTGGSGINGAIMKNDAWCLIADGAIFGMIVWKDDMLIACIDNPGQSPLNWEFKTIVPPQEK